MRSSAQNSPGVHWCRHRVRFNKVPKNVPKVPVKVWDLVQGQVRFNRVSEIQRRFHEARVQREVTFNRFDRVPENSGEGLGGARSDSTRFRRRFRRSS
jgi:hypothetical protein